jgi:recombination protein RecT
MTTTSKAVAKINKHEEITTQVLNKIEVFRNAGQINIPKDFDPANALQSAYLILSDMKVGGVPVLDHCTKTSISTALLKMCVLGLSPVKKQCNLIAYGKELKCDQEYAGDIVLAKRFGDLKDINAVTIYDKDEFEFKVDVKTGRKAIVKHIQSLNSFGGGKETIRGAYAVMEFNDGSFDAEIMNMKQIEASWAMGGAKGKSKAHLNFPDQMAEKTVIKRACKLLIRSSDDNILFAEINEEQRDKAKDDVDSEIQDNANAEIIGMEDEDIKTIDVQGETVDEQPENKDEKKTTETVEKKEKQPIVDKGGQATIGPGF